jgi:plastocyanin
MTFPKRAAGLLASLAMSLAACGGSGPQAAATALPSPTAPSQPPEYRWPLHATVTLTPNGVEPPAVTVNVGGRVTFVNDDTVAHEIVSDPYLRHDECPPINRVGFLAPGQQGDSAIFEAVRDCGFHDHLDPTGATGRIQVRIE